MATLKPKVPFTVSEYSYELDTKEYHRIRSEDLSPWKLGDWCICQMEIKQIISIDKETGNPDSVSCGVITSSTTDWTDEIVPLTLTTKSIAEYYNTLYKQLQIYRDLNFAVLFSYFCKKCLACLHASAEDLDSVTDHYDEISAFQAAVIEKANRSKETTVAGINIFR